MKDSTAGPVEVRRCLSKFCELEAGILEGRRKWKPFSFLNSCNELSGETVTASEREKASERPAIKVLFSWHQVQLQPKAQNSR